MATFMAALGFTSAQETVEKVDTLDTDLEEPPTVPPTYFQQVAADIVAADPVFGRARVPNIAAHRDKESLLVDLIDLKKACEETEIHLNMHKQFYFKLLDESRRLEREVEELELRGNYSAPRTGGVTRLESRFKGLEARFGVLEKTIAQRKHGDLAALRLDLGTTHTREVEVERDVIAGEISRLRVFLKHMKLLHEEVREDNITLKLCKSKLAWLAVENPKVKQAVESKRADIQQARDEIEFLKQDGEAKIERMELLAKEDVKFEKKMAELQPKAQVIKLEKNKIARKHKKLEFEQMIFNRDFRRDHPATLMAA